MEQNNLENNVSYGVKDDFKMEKPKRNNPLPAIFLIIMLSILSYYTYKRVAYKDIVDTAKIPVVETTRLERGKIEKKSSVMGTIMPSDTFYVVTKVSGEITKIYVENGQKVKMGDKICEIDNSKQIEAAYIQYDAAKKAYERMEKLYNAGDISAQSFEAVKAQYEGAKLSYDTQVEFATPVATGDGVIENTNMTLNVTINQGTVLTYITSSEAKNVEFAVTERVLDGIRVGDTVSIEKQGKIYDGYITEKSNLISSNTGLFNVKAIITSDNNLASGGMAKVNFVYERSINTDLIERDIVYYENNKPFVYIVDNNNSIKKRFITLGISNDVKVEVLSGVDINTKLISTWNNDLVEGVVVEVLNEDAGKELENIYNIAKMNETTETYETKEYDEEEVEEVEEVEEAINVSTYSELETTEETIETTETTEETVETTEETEVVEE